MRYLELFIIFICMISSTSSKYVEGHIKTMEDWVFVSRFCFLSEYGRYEYFIEYDRKFGDLQLLLYYDQWNSVYKSTKTCQEKVSVLSPDDNQIVTLSAKSPYFHKSGCTLRSSSPPKEQSTTTVKPSTLQKYPEAIDSTYFDQFLKTTTEISPSTTAEAFIMEYNLTETDLDVDIFNATTVDYKMFEGDQVRRKNGMENGTEFRNDVEELFDVANVTTRIKRDIYPQNFGNTERKQKIYVTCHNSGFFQSSRQRWWYIVIANCGANRGIDVRFKFRMTNGPTGDFWHEHFSADEMYIPPILLVEVLVYTFLLLAIFVCGIELKTRNLYHCTYRLFTLSALLHWCGVLLNSVTWTKYAVSGIGPFTVFGGLFMGAAEIAFLLLTLLMAKGYTITRARLSTASTVKITVFINFYIVLFISLYIYQSEAFDPGDVLNLYESIAGYSLAFLRCFAWAFFLISCTTTVKKFPEKKNFYLPFGIFGSVWILAGPILILMVVNLLDNWVRESVVFLFMFIVSFIGHSLFLFLAWPSRINKSFPYHVKTSSIGIASNEDDGADYPRHIYEPTAPDATIIIPLSRRTEEFVNGVYNPGFTRDAEYFRSNAPSSIPQQCLPSQTHSRLPSPKTGLSTLTLYGHDTLMHDDEESLDTNLQAENGIFKHESSETVSKRLSSFESDDRHVIDRSIDSGHLSLSLEATGSPNSNEVTMTSPADSLSPPYSAPMNPFKFKAATKSAPNKIILDPIQLPTILKNNIHENTAVANNNNVPRHLFTIKKK